MKKFIVLFCILATCAWIEAKPMWFFIDITCDEFGCESKSKGDGNGRGGFRQNDYHREEYDEGYYNGRYHNEEYTSGGIYRGGGHHNDRHSAEGDEYGEYLSENGNSRFGSNEYDRREHIINRLDASEYDQMGLGSVYDRQRYITNGYGINKNDVIFNQGGGYEFKGNDCEYGSGDRFNVAEYVRCGYGSGRKYGGRRPNYGDHKFGNMGSYEDDFRGVDHGGDQYGGRRLSEERDMIFEDEESVEDSGEE